MRSRMVGMAKAGLMSDPGVMRGGWSAVINVQPTCIRISPKLMLRKDLITQSPQRAIVCPVRLPLH
jgi:hypothetical protein